MSLRPLRIAARTELATLIALLVNLGTVHLQPVSSLAGPVHGCAYLFAVVAVRRLPAATTAARAVALIPGVGGLLALRRLDLPGAADGDNGPGAPPRPPRLMSAGLRRRK